MCHCTAFSWNFRAGIGKQGSLVEKAILSEKNIGFDRMTLSFKNINTTPWMLIKCFLAPRSRPIESCESGHHTLSRVESMSGKPGSSWLLRGGEVCRDFPEAFFGCFFGGDLEPALLLRVRWHMCYCYQSHFCDNDPAMATHLLWSIICTFVGSAFTKPWAVTSLDKTDHESVKGPIEN